MYMNTLEFFFVSIKVTYQRLHAFPTLYQKVGIMAWVIIRWHGYNTVVLYGLYSQNSSIAYQEML
jgi:hypothetical protein